MKFLVTMCQREIKIEELKEIQLEILKNIHKFCITYSIRYSLACGTLLGCVRHGGYIPWDDDIDIYVPREDYDRLVRIFPQVFMDRYKLVSLERDENWDRPYAKAFDVRTILFESGTTDPLSVNIDIFPVDEVPENNLKWNIYNSIRIFINNVYQLKFVNYSSERSFIKNFAAALVKYVTCPLSKRKLAQLIDRYSRLYNKKGYSRYFENILGLLQKKPFNKSLFDDLILLKFEDQKFYCFRDFDSYLTSGYGDWRTLPPINKQVSHHSFRAYYISDLREDKNVINKG